MQNAIAVISDIHSNFEALTAVLDDVKSQEVPRIVCLGDIVGYASLASSCGWPYIISPDDARRHFSNQPSRLAFCGHTHKPMVWWQDTPGGQVTQRTAKDVMPLPPSGKTLVNVGAVGQPRDGDTRARYVIYRPDQNTVEFRRVEYDIKRTKRKIIHAGLPRFTAQRLSLGR
jgi:diadenosine tetraphosphatase ApaH/serine/threonine PP2A family protein phosphatase